MDFQNDQGSDGGDEFFAAVDDVSAGGQRLPYLEEGQYVLNIDKILFLITRPPKRNPMYIVEFTILESSNESRPVGMQCSWSTKLNIDMGPINMKRFVGAALGYASVQEIDASVDSKLCRYTTTDAQPFTGVQVHCQCRNIITQGEKKQFTEHRYSPMAGYSWNDLNPPTPEELAAAGQVA